MEWRYRLSRSARRDLQEISDYWTSHAGEDAALRIVREIVTTILNLSQLPRMGRLVEAFGPGVRRFSNGRYLIYYRIRRRHVHILHVLHGARDQPRAFGL